MISLFATLLANFGSTSVAYLAGAAAGGYATAHGLLLSRNARLSRTKPVAKLGKAALGPTEVSGIAVGPYTVTAPITGTACFGYRTVAWRTKTANNPFGEEILAEEKLHVPFYLDDSTGKLLIDPSGAEFDLRQDFRHEFQGAARSTDNPSLQSVHNFLARHSISECTNLRVEEFCIKPKSFLFICGTLAKNPGLAVAPRALPETPPPARKAIIGTLNDFANEFPVPALAKLETGTAEAAPQADQLIDLIFAQSAADASTQMTQQGKIAAALERAGVVFPDIRNLLRDGDTAGTEEPTTADSEKTAERFVGDTQATVQTDETSGEFDLKPPIVLMKHRTLRYVVSWRDPRKSVAPLPRKAMLMLWGGAAITLISLSLLAAQLGWL